MKQWKKYILSTTFGLLLIAQIILAFVFGKVNELKSDVMMWAGWIIWILSVILGWLPILILKRQGGVKKGESYVHTTKIVDSGLYSILRHPQYTAGILFSLALILISQNEYVTIMGIIAISLMYIDILKADKHEIEKFGDEYKEYMKRVPRINFILGIIRLLIRKRKK